MRWLVALILFFPILLRAATGDIVDSGNITSIGVAEVRIEGFPTNGVFFNGLQNVTNYAAYDGTNEIWFQQPGPTNALQISLTSWGWYYGTNYAWPRTVYGTKLARKPYPNQAQFAVVTNIGAPNATRYSIWLNDFIYTTDSNLVGSVIANGFASNAAATGLSFSNNSTIPPWTPKCNMLNWGWEDVTNTSFTVRIVAYDHYKIDGVSTIFTHTNGMVSSNYTMVRTPDNTFTLGQRPAVFSATHDLSAWTSSVFTVDYIVNPRIGTPFSTYANLYTGHAPQPQRLTNLYNPSGLFNTNTAVYDPTAAGPGAVTNVAPALVNAAHYFPTLKVASQRVASSNLYRGGTVWVRAGGTNIGGPSAGYSRDVDSRIKWKPYPGDVFTIVTNSDLFGINPGGRLQIEDCNVWMTNNNLLTLFDNCERVLFLRCDIMSTGTIVRATTSSDTSIVAAEATRIRQLSGGLRPTGVDKVAWQLLGCNLNGFTNTWIPWLAIGNWHTNPASTNFTITQNPTVLVFPGQQRIFAHNIIKGMWGDNTFAGEFGSSVWSATNDAFVGNLMEGIAITGGAAKSLTLWASPTNMTGIVCHNNSIYGFRHQFGYNETGAAWKEISCKNNSFDVFGWVTDAIGGPNNASYTNNWWVMNGVGMIGNAIPNTSEVFHGDAEYAHFQSYFRPSSVRKPYPWWGVVERRALSSTTVYGRGNGDYHPMPYALTRTIPIDPLYEYDIENRPYTLYGSGVYASPYYTFISGSGSTIISGTAATIIAQ
jgi:hypothetical protein